MDRFALGAAAIIVIGHANVASCLSHSVDSSRAKVRYSCDTYLVYEEFQDNCASLCQVKLVSNNASCLRVQIT